MDGSLPRQQLLHAGLTCLTAMSCPVSWFSAVYTLPKAPAPIISPFCQLTFCPELKRSTCHKETLIVLQLRPSSLACALHRKTLLQMPPYLQCRHKSTLFVFVGKAHTWHNPASAAGTIGKASA